MKNGMKVIAILTTLVMLLSIGFTGCGGGKPAENAAKSDEQKSTTNEAPKQEVKEVTVRYGMWGGEEEQKIAKENAADSEKAFPGLKIEVTPYPDSVTFWQQLPAQVAAKTAPDIIQLTNEGHIEYIVKGAFAPLDDEVKAAGLDMSRYDDTAKGIWTYNGKLYGIPLGASPAVFTINKDMWDAAGLKEYPKTWDEVKTAAKALTQNGVAGLIVNLHEFTFTNFALTYGGGWGYGKTINSDANVKAMEFIVDMFKEKLAVAPKQAGLGWDGEVFAQKKGAMAVSGFWYKGFLKNAAPDIKYVAVPMPKGTESSCTMHSIGIVVLKDSPDKQAAVKAAYHMTNEEGLSKLSANTGVRTSLKSLAPKYYEVNPEYKDAMEPMMALSKDFGYPPETKKFIDAIVGAMEAKILANDSRSVKQILDEIQQKFQ